MYQCSCSSLAENDNDKGRKSGKNSPGFGVFLQLNQNENEKVLKNLLRQQSEKCLDVTEVCYSNFESILFFFAFQTSFILCFFSSWHFSS